MKQFYFKKFHDKDLMKEFLCNSSNVKVLIKKVQMKIDLAEKVLKWKILMENFSNEKGMKEAVLVKSSFLINKISEKNYEENNDKNNRMKKLF